MQFPVFLASNPSILGFFLVAAMMSFGGCVQFRMSPKEVEQFYADKSKTPRLVSYEVMGRKMHYAETGKESGPLVVFVHGSPGSWSAFRDFMADPVMLDRAKIISVDRPGFGYSEFGHPEVSLARQAEMIAPILEKNQHLRPIIVVGHSLGGAVIAKIGMDYTDRIDGLVMIAPSIDPDLEPKEWYRHGLRLPLINMLVPRSFMVSNEEILPLRGELTRMLDDWDKITVPVTVIHGEKDNWVPVGNADFAKEKLVNAEARVIIDPEVGHFIPWQRPDIVRRAIISHLPNPDAILTSQ